jgi:hypothetical protein
MPMKLNQVRKRRVLRSHTARTMIANDAPMTEMDTTRRARLRKDKEPIILCTVNKQWQAVRGAWGWRDFPNAGVAGVCWVWVNLTCTQETMPVNTRRWVPHPRVLHHRPVVHLRGARLGARGYGARRLLPTGVGRCAWARGCPAARRGGPCANVPTAASIDG